MKPLNFIIFLFRKSFFFKGCSFTPSPFLFAKIWRKENFKEMEKLLKRKNKDNLPQKVYIKYFTKTDNFKVQDNGNSFT